jgi:hypothetical protein
VATQQSREGDKRKEIEMKQITLPAIEARQNGTSLIITKMRAGDLSTFTVVHPYSANKTPDDPEQGYQRPAESPRIK